MAVKMSSLDDELALFESEISSISTFPSNPAQNGTGLSSITQDSKPTLNVAPVTAAQPPTLSNIVPPFMPHQLNRPSGSLIPPPLPPLGIPFSIGGLRPGVFVPHQLRPPIRAPASVIEGAPTLYKAEPSTSNDTPKTTALAADIEAVQKQKEADIMSSQMSGKSDKMDKKKKYVRTAGGQVWEDNSLSDWDPNDFRIFCGDLGNEVSDELLAKAFRRFPSFQKAKVIRDKRSNKSKGFGFVSFKSQEDYVRAIREMDGKYVGNRPIKLRKSQWKDRQIEVVKKKIKQKTKLGLF